MIKTQKDVEYWFDRHMQEKREEWRNDRYLEMAGYLILWALFFYSLWMVFTVEGLGI